MKKVATFLLVLALVLALSGAGMLGGCGEEEAKEPTVTAVNPGSGRVGETLSVTITGTYLEEASAVSFGAGITVSSFTADSDTQITASIAIGSGASQGARTVSVTTPDGTATKSGGFTVTSPLAPSVTGISPDSGEQAESLDVTITGSNFVAVSDVSLGEGVTVNSFTVGTETQITASIAVAAGATVGSRTVSVTGPDGTATKTGGFAVASPLAPSHPMPVNTTANRSAPKCFAADSKSRFTDGVYLSRDCGLATWVTTRPPVFWSSSRGA